MPHLELEEESQSQSSSSTSSTTPLRSSTQQGHSSSMKDKGQQKGQQSQSTVNLDMTTTSEITSPDSHDNQNTTSTSSRTSRSNRHRHSEEDRGDFSDEEEDEEEGDDEEEDGLLFSCRCESAKPVFTLLSCLRNVSSDYSSSAAVGVSSMSTSADGGGIGRSQRQLLQASGGIGGSGSGQRGNRVQYATVFVSEKSLVFRVYGVGRQSRATVDMQAGLFSEFYVAEQTVPILEEVEEENHNNNSNGKDKDKDASSIHTGATSTTTEIIKGGEFGINLTTVLECLSILGPSSLERTKLCLSYDSQSAILKIELLEEDLGVLSTAGGGGSGSGMVLSNCAIPGMSVADNDDDEDGNQGLDHAFRLHPIVARARIRSDFLREAINELADVAGAISASIIISRKGLELATFGHSTECLVVLPYLGNHPEIFVSLEGIDSNNNTTRSHHVGSDGKRNSQSHGRTYPLHSIISAMRGLDIASETCISMNDNGMIAIQHQVINKVGNGQPNYVDFIMGCLEEEEKEYDDTENDAYTTQVTMEAEEDGELRAHPLTYESREDSYVYDDDVDTRNNSASQQEGWNNLTAQSKNDNQSSGSEIDNGSDSETDSDATGTSTLLFGGLAKNIGTAVTATQSNRRRRHTRQQSRSNDRSKSDTPQVSQTPKRRRRHIASKDSEDSNEERNAEKQLSDNEPKKSQDGETEDAADDNDHDTDNTDNTHVSLDTTYEEKENSEDDTKTPAPSSPILMYGDTHLEASADF